MLNATAITTGSANQRPNTPCIRLWIDVTFRGLEDSYCFICGRQRAAVARYQMICLVLWNIMLSIFIRLWPGLYMKVYLQNLNLVSLDGSYVAKNLEGWAVYQVNYTSRMIVATCWLSLFGPQSLCKLLCGAFAAWLHRGLMNLPWAMALISYDWVRSLPFLE